MGANFYKNFLFVNFFIFALLMSSALPARSESPLARGPLGSILARSSAKKKPRANLQETAAVAVVACIGGGITGMLGGAIFSGYKKVLFNPLHYAGPSCGVAAGTATVMTGLSGAALAEPPTEVELQQMLAGTQAAVTQAGPLKQDPAGKDFGQAAQAASTNGSSAE